MPSTSNPSDQPIPAPPGRDREAETLDAALDRLLGGSGGVVLIEGEGGVGKTTLAYWLGEAARAARCHVLEAPCYHLSTATPYACVVAALRPAVGSATPELTRGLPSLGLLFEDAVTADDTHVSPDNAALARTRLHASLITLLGRLAADRPVVMLVDDLQWADPSSIEVLQLLAGNLVDIGVLLVATLRPFEAERRAESRSLLRALGRVGDCRTIEVDRLGEDAIAELLSLRLGPIYPSRLVREIHVRSGGTPLVAEQLVQAWIDEGVLRPVGRRWELGDRLDAPLERVAEELIGTRLRRLDDDDRVLLAAVALGSEPVPTDLLVEVVPRSEHDVLARLDRLRREGVVDRVDVDGVPAWTPHHPIIGEVVVAELDTGVAVEIHAHYASALERGDLARRARHLLHLPVDRLDPAQTSLLLAAGRAAIDSGAAAEATRMLGVALQAREAAGPLDDAELADICRWLGVAWHRRGEDVVATEHLTRARDIARRSGDTEREVLAEIDLQEVNWRNPDRSSDFDRVVGELLPELTAANRPDLAHLLLRHLFTTQVRAGRPGPADQALDALAKLTSEVGTDDARQWHEVIDAVARFLRLDDVEDAAGAVAGVLASPDTELAQRAAHLCLDAALFIGGADSIRAAVEDDRRIRARWGDWPSWRIGLAEWDLALGEGDRDRAQESVHASSAVGEFARTDCYLYVSGVLDALLAGEPPPLMPFDPSARPSGDDVADDLVRIGALFGSAQPQPELLDAVVDGYRQRRVVAGMPWAAAAAAGLAFQCKGDRDAFDRWRDEVARADRGRGRLTAWGLLLAARWSDGDAASALDAAACFERLGRPFDAAVATLHALEVDDGIGDGVGVDLVNAAAERFVGWECLAARVDAVAQRRGWSLRPLLERRLDDLGLTRRERQVAEVVAEGLSNQEVANRLFVSVRTVTSHLDHIYTKLGIGSRRELTEMIENLRT